MNQSVGSVALYNIIIAFLIITFAFLAGAISYSKAFRVNTRIINSIEKFEGYNVKASAEINKTLNNLGYRRSLTYIYDCPTRNGAQALAHIGSTSETPYEYCVYQYATRNNEYYFGVLTYMYVDVPVIGETFKVPVFSVTASYYRFPVKFPRID